MHTELLVIGSFWNTASPLSAHSYGLLSECIIALDHHAAMPAQRPRKTRD